MAAGAGAACSSEKTTDRWTTTENTTIKIDWDKVNEAYKAADGPTDFERRVNEIYEGDEVISVSVRDENDKTQVVTGFFDNNKDGKVDEPEKIFTIKRELGNGEAKYQTVGHNAYGYYHSPFLTIASGMAMGMMMSSLFSPAYVPIYTTPYVTHPNRVAEISTQRSSYRASDPARFSKPSRTGRTYGGGASSGGSTPRVRGGSRFGVRGGGPLLAA
jgi:hypothetical protein